MRGKTLLELGRISNLPTVWTNCLSALALSVTDGALGTGADATPTTFAPLSLRFVLVVFSMSVLYTGGMFLNDAFDREVDARQAPSRPIPSGRVSAQQVFLLGGLQLLCGLLLVAWLSVWRFGHWLSPATAATGGLVLLILLYDVYHKSNPFSPLLMGLCRVGVYFSVGLLTLASAVPALDGGWLPIVSRSLAAGASVLLAYLMALTFWAKGEGRGRRPPVPIHVMIAGISLVDAGVMVAAGQPLWALGGVLGFFGTLRLQKFVRGT